MRTGREERSVMDINQLIADNGAYFYLIAFLWTFLEGETVVLFAGFAAAQGLLDPILLLVAAWLGSFSGDQTYFWVGRQFGPRLLDRFPRWRHGVDVALVLAGAIQYRVYPDVSLYLRCAQPVLVRDGGQRYPMEALPVAEFSRRRAVGRQLHCCRLFPGSRLSAPFSAISRSPSAWRCSASFVFSPLPYGSCIGCSAAGSSCGCRRAPRSLHLRPEPSGRHQLRAPTALPIVRPRTASARPALTAISASPFEFSYQKAAPAGTAEKVDVRASSRPPT